MNLSDRSDVEEPSESYANSVVYFTIGVFPVFSSVSVSIVIGFLLF